MDSVAITKLIERFEGLAARGRSIKVIHGFRTPLPNFNRHGRSRGSMERVPTTSLSESDTRSWIVQAGAALADVFPERHPTRTAWTDLLSKHWTGQIVPWLGHFQGVFDGATELVRQGHVGTFAATVQAETLGELLDQADDLARQGHVSAAAVVAGGALETHLRHLVERHGLTFPGPGSLETFNTTIGQARNAGTVVYTAGDGKLVTAWGGIRNEAAHKPMDFRLSKEDVSTMILGIRQFLARVP